MFLPSQPLTLPILAELLGAHEPVRLAPEAAQRLAAPPAAQAASQPPGWPYLLAPELPTEPTNLAASLLLAYAAGTGPALPAPLVRRLLLLKAYRLSQRSAGTDPAIVRRLLDFFSREVWPVVPEQGALGLLGNQIPLAHLCLPLLGLGEVDYQGYRLAAADVLGLFGWEPLALPAQAALALLHGGEFTLAYATEALARASHLLAAAEAIGALAAEVYGAPPLASPAEPAHPEAEAEPLAGPALPSQAEASLPAATAATFERLAPVHEVARQALARAQQATEAALQAASEPGLLFSADELLPGPHLVGEALPLLLGPLAQAVADLGTRSARRTARLVAGERQLPRYLAPGAAQPFGLLALPQAAASLVAQSQQLARAVGLAEMSPEGAYGPLSDGAAGAAEALQLLEATEQLLGIELLAAAQALEFRRPASGSPALEAVVAALRAHVTFVVPGQALAPGLHLAARFVREYQWA